MSFSFAFSSCNYPYNYVTSTLFLLNDRW
uniref:Uncharacterized protein n=1 Tax=Rhizophora mucronata TaxID=61149 RepID=A0A2P2N5C1_RHIMU